MTIPLYKPWFILLRLCQVSHICSFLWEEIPGQFSSLLHFQILCRAVGWEWPQRCSDLNSMHFSLTGRGSDSPCPADELYCWCCEPAFPPPLRLSVKKQIFCIILGLKGTLPAFMHPKKGATESKHCDSKIKNPKEKGKWQEGVSWSPFMLGSRWGKILRTLFPQKHHGWVKKKLNAEG